MRKQHRHDGRLLVLVAVLAVLAALAAAGFARESVRTRQIDREIRAMKEEAERLRVRNFEISALESSLSSGEFLEREARMKLGLQKAGEQVVVVRKDHETADPPPHEATGGSHPSEWTNARKWWTYFTDPEEYERYAAIARDAENPAPHSR